MRISNTELQFKHCYYNDEIRIIDISTCMKKNFLNHFNIYITDNCDLKFRYRNWFYCTYKNFKNVDKWIKTNNRQLQITIIRQIKNAIDRIEQFYPDVALQNPKKFNKIKKYYNSLFNELTNEEKLLLILDN